MLISKRKIESRKERSKKLSKKRPSKDVGMENVRKKVM